MQHLPLGAASMEMGVPLSALKRMMRLNHVGAWPFRQLHALSRHADMLRARLEQPSDDEARRSSMLQWLGEIEAERDRIVGGHLSLKASHIALTTEMKRLLCTVRESCASS